MSDEFALCWNNFADNITTGFQALLTRGNLCDVTLGNKNLLLAFNECVMRPKYSVSCGRKAFEGPPSRVVDLQPLLPRNVLRYAEQPPSNHYFAQNERDIGVEFT